MTTEVKKTEAVEEAQKPVKAWPIEGETVVLAHVPNSRKKAGETERPYMTPPTVDGIVNIGMEATIHLPSLEAQKAGFTPYMKRGHKAEDATDLLLRQFPGIYKPIKKGETTDDD